MNKFAEMLHKWNNNQERGAQIRLAEKLNVSRGLVSRWVSGEARPGPDYVKQIANVFQVSITEVKQAFGIDTKPAPTVNAYPITAYVPVLGSVKANRFNLAVVYAEPELYMPTLKSGDKDYALRVMGDCMEPEIKDDQLIIIRPCVITDVKEGEIVIARIGEECTLKRFYLKGNTIWLVPDNKDYEPISGSLKEIEIIGRVIDIPRKPTRKRRPDFLEDK